ncbi:MAG: hypothetical protein IPM24_18240 [Bryobacterales bacterium]|nr:hypothetical protein [Bryobacterales bacterium]
MVQVQQRLLITLLFTATVWAAKFYPDDPLLEAPPPVRVASAQPRRASGSYDYLLNTFRPPAISPEEIPPSAPVNTMGEVFEPAWYEHRHSARRMTAGELVRGAGNQPPSPDAPWDVIAPKVEGVTPGFVIRDGSGREYLLKFDSQNHPEMASAAEVIGSKFFYALGYHTPENTIVRFRREQIRPGGTTLVDDPGGRRRPMTEADLNRVLLRCWKDRDGRYRAVASRLIDGKRLGPFQFSGTRADDPNDIVPHERRRELRGLFLMSAWLGHWDIRPVNTVDSLVDEGRLRYIKHFLIDFGATLGSGTIGPKSPRAGHAPMFRFRNAAMHTLTLGFSIEPWMRIRYPDLPGVGRFDAESFDPATWEPAHTNAAFASRLPADDFWAVRRILAFRDDEIAALVRTGEFSDSRAADWLTECLIERRDRIGRYVFEQSLPLDEFRVEGGRLRFTDLAVRHGFAPERAYEISWTVFDNERGIKAPLPGERTAAVPSVRTRFLAAAILDSGQGEPLTVYLRRRAGRWEPVGVER